MTSIVPSARRGNANAIGKAGRVVCTVAEVAALLDLSVGSAYALVRSGQIPAKRIGARWVIPRRRFHEWLDGPADESKQDSVEPQGEGRSA